MSKIVRFVLSNFLSCINHLSVSQRLYRRQGACTLTFRLDNKLLYEDNLTIKNDQNQRLYRRQLNFYECAYFYRIDIA